MTVHYTTVDGKEVSYQERTPIRQIANKNAEPGSRSFTYYHLTDFFNKG